jgi:hypothetical protein
MPAEVDLTLALPGLSPVCGKPIIARFDDGRLSSDGGILLLAEVERRLGIAERLARCVEDPRAPNRIVHGLAEMIRFRALAIAAGYLDANDCDALRRDPVFKMAVGRLPETGPDLCTQPIMTRLENLPGTVAFKRMMAAMVELFCDSFDPVPRRIEAGYRRHRGPGLRPAAALPVQCAPRQPLLHANPYLRGDDREAGRGFPGPGKTPNGVEVALAVRHVVRAIRARWPRVDVLIRDESHYGRRKPWPGASAIGSATSSAWRATRCCCAA